MKPEGAFKQFKKLFRERFPGTRIETLEPMKGADYYVALHVSPEDAEEAVELSSQLNYKFYTEHGIYIFGIVEETAAPTAVR